MEEKKAVSTHRFHLDNRKKGTITGVTDVSSFDEKEILLETRAGIMHIKGNQMSITRLNLEQGEVDIDGRVDSIVYTKDGESQAQRGTNLLKRLFR